MWRVALWLLAACRAAAPATVEVVATEADGRLMAGALVDLVACPPQDRPDLAYLHVGGTTGDDGRCLLEVEPPDGVSTRVWVVVRAPGHSPWRPHLRFPTRSSPEFEEPPLVEAGQHLRLNAVLQAGTTLAGRVTDRDGHPIAGATMMLSRRQIRASANDQSMHFGADLVLPPPCVTDDDGRYEYTALSVEDAAAHGWMLMLQPDDGDHAPAASVCVERRVLADGGVATVDFALDHGLELAGIVRDEAGRQKRGAKITAWLVAGEQLYVPWLDRAATTRDDGRFVLRGLAAGRYQLEVAADGAAPLVQTVTVGAVNELVELAVGRGATVSGRLLDGRGQPLPRCPIQILTADRAVYRTTTTDAEGRFELLGLPPQGEATLTIAFGQG